MKKRSIAMKVITVVLALTVMMPFLTWTASAATSVSVNGDDEIACGDEFTVRIEFAGDNTAEVDGQIGYDPEKLQYVSGAEDGGEGYVILKKGGGDGSVTFDVTFRAIKGGNTGLDVSSSEICDINKNPVDNCADTKVIHISGDAADDDENVVREEDPLPEEAEEAEDSENQMILPLILIAGGVAIIAVIIISAAVRKKKGKKADRSKGDDK